MTKEQSPPIIKTMKTKILSHNYTGKSLVVVYSDAKGVETKIVESSHPNWRQVEKLYRQGKYEDMIPLLDVGQAIANKFQGKFVVQDGQVYYNGEPIHGYLFDRILFFMKEGLKYDRLVKFAENLYANPSVKARDEAYKFLEHKNMPITEDGCFLAYKGVQNDYYSITGGDIEVIKGKVKNGKILNAVGEDIEVKRSQVDSNANNGCSKGLHAGSYDYANGFKGSGRMMIVKINPKNIVSVPTDCNCQKLRSCAYTVIAEEGRKLHEVKDINFDRVAKVRNNSGPKRNSLGQFC